MSLAIAILADKDLDRTTQLARFVAKAGINVCIHVDASVSDRKFDGVRANLSHHRNIRFAPRIVCEWGRFSLVQAELTLAKTILKAWPETTHVQLLSGDSLPIRPLAELQQVLRENPDTDFIESVIVGENNWITDGLESERFTLKFPYSWKTQRRRFDFFVGLQRALHIKRRMPDGLPPHIGSQWWCLSRKTLEAILNDPQKSEYDAYFTQCWIPDESYFQTLVRKHSASLKAHSLLYSRFDFQGKPTVFYDDHLTLLNDVDGFFIRKVWAGADRLYRHFLGSTRVNVTASPESLHDKIATATTRRTIGRPGLRMQSAAPNQWHEGTPVTAGKYQVFTGVRTTFPDFDQWYQTQTGSIPHGQIFAKDKVQFSGDTITGPGGLSSDARVRNAAPDNFLRNLIWQTQAHGVAFHFETGDLPEIETQFIRDKNAHIFHIRYGWLPDLMAKKITDVSELRMQAIILLNREQAYMAKLFHKRAACHIRICTLGEALSDPRTILSQILTSTDTANGRSPMLLPTRIPTDGLSAFAQHLENIGAEINMDYLTIPTPATQLPRASRAVR